ncbi:MAG: adenylate/guanylate cyclase domain-containing protein [Bryobacteraceae bacterium]
MSYRKRLLIALLGTAVLTTALAVTAMYFVARDKIVGELRSKVKTIASTVASQVDGEAVAAVRSRDDESSAGYKQVRDHLRRARDINRRGDVWVNYLFIVRRSTQDSAVTVSVVDPEESVEFARHVGDVWHNRLGKRMDWEQAEAAEQLGEGERGLWLTGTAPVRNGLGESVGALVVELSADQIDRGTRAILFAGAGSALFGVLFATVAALLLSQRMSRPLLSLKSALESIGRGEFDVTIHTDSVSEFSQVAETVQTLGKGLQERDRVKKAFSRYLSPQVMDSVMAAETAPRLHGERSKVTIMFVDIRGFTTMSENMRPEQSVFILNAVFEKTVEVIFRHGGSLDKFLGDGLMAVFGAPRQDINQEENAVRAALEIQRQIDILNGSEEFENIPNIRLGIGINSGVAVVGNIGSAQRMEYTAIGDTVNVAARLQSATGELGVEVLVSEYTFNAVRGMFRARNVGELAVKGREDTVEGYVIEGELKADT